MDCSPTMATQTQRQPAHHNHFLSTFITVIKFVSYSWGVYKILVLERAVYHWFRYCPFLGSLLLFFFVLTLALLRSLVCTHGEYKDYISIYIRISGSSKKAISEIIDAANIPDGQAEM